VTTSSSNQRGHPIRRDVHIFTVGQAVRLKAGFGTSHKHTDVFHVTATLPPSGTERQYRIRNKDENHERVTTEDRLEPIDVSQDGAALLERTFGHEQGTETQQSRDQEAEAGKGAAQA
jgi:hypothetical protein